MAATRCGAVGDTGGGAATGGAGAGDGLSDAVTKSGTEIVAEDADGGAATGAADGSAPLSHGGGGGICGGAPIEASGAPQFAHALASSGTTAPHD